MKRVIISLAILLSISATSFAGQNNRPHKGNRSLPKELKLSDDQQKQVETLNADFGTKFKALKENDALSKDDKRSQSKELRNQHRAAVTNILTPEQKEQLKELKGKKYNREDKVARAGKDGKRDHNTHKHNIYKDLNLTAEQEDQIKELNKDFRTKSKESKEQHITAINQILTPEQQAILKEQGKHNGRKFGHGGKRGGYAKLDPTTIAKISELEENYVNSKKAIKMSRIAPEAQDRKLSELRKNYRKDKREIIKEARNTKA